MRACYGSTYYYKDFYSVAELSKLWKSKMCFSVGAFTPKGELVGHLALFLNEFVGGATCSGGVNDCSLGEPAAGVVTPDWRGRRLIDSMLAKLVELSMDHYPALRGLFISAVTSHTRSQKSAYHFGFSDCGNLIGYYPEVDPTGITVSAGRISPVISFWPTRELSQRTIYVPATHAEVVKNIYSQLGVSINCEVGGDCITNAEDRAKLEVTFSSGMRNGVIVVRELGFDTFEQIEKAVGSLESQKAEAVLCYLSLRDPFMPKLAEQLAKLGFFFTGVMPETAQGDSLLLMHLLEPRYDFSKIKLTTDSARECLNHIEQDMKRVMRL